jgi:hypothetical protein
MGRSMPHATTNPGTAERPIWMLVPLLLALLPFAEPLNTGAAAGSGPDLVNTLWAMWWFQQEWMGAGWGGWSPWFNFPFGGSGAILSPLSATLWSLLDGLFGPSAASSWTSISMLYMTLAAVAWLALSLGFGRFGVSTAVLAFLASRYFVYTLGETGVVGVAALPMLVGFGALARSGSGNRWWILAALCTGLQGLENPYLAPVLPLAMICLVPFRQGRAELAKALALGFLLAASAGLVHQGASASGYESLRPSGFSSIGGFFFPVVEREWARIGLEGMLVPGRIIWPQGGTDSIHMAGRGYVSLAALALSIGALAVHRRLALAWLGLAALGALLSSGSIWGDTTSLFGLFNSLCERLLRPLTQPSRYMLLCTLGLSIGAAAALDSLVKKRSMLAYGAWCLLLFDALAFGGLSLRLPSTPFPSGDCLESLSEEEGGVLLWPWDGMDDELKEATLTSRLFQMVHERPAATIGTGSWPLVGEVFPGHVLRLLGWREALEGKGSLEVQKLSNWGYRWAIVDHGAYKTHAKRGQNVFGIERRVGQCPGYEVFALPRPRSTAGDPVHPVDGSSPGWEGR